MWEGCPPPHWGRGLGRGLCPSPENFGTFLLEMAHFGANSVVYFNGNVRLFTARTMTVTVYCWRLTGPLTGEGSGEGQKILGLFT